MKHTQRLWSICLGIVASLACIGGLPKAPVHAQTSCGGVAQTTCDDGLFTVFTNVNYSGNYIYANSYYIEDYDDYGIYGIQTEPPYWSLSGSSYVASGVSNSFNRGPVPLGDTYVVVFAYSIEFAYDTNPDENNCGTSECYDSPTGIAYIYVPPPPATVTGISPSDWTAGQSYTGVQITGTNFGSTLTVTLSDSTIQITRQAYNTSTSGGTSTTSIDIYVPSDTPSEPVTVTIAPGAYGNSFTSGSGGSLSGSSTAEVIGAQQNAAHQILMRLQPSHRLQDLL